jgi:hypothetical protein
MANYTRETVLPTRGKLYGDKLPDGTIQYRMMETRDEKVIAGSRGSAEGLVTNLLNAVITTPGIKAQELLSIDRAFLLVQLRILSYGSNYVFKAPCPACGVTTRFEQELNALGVTMADDDFSEPLEIMLPVLEEPVWLRYLRGSDEETISAEAKRITARSTPGAGDAAYLLRLSRYIHHTLEVDEKDFIGKQVFVQGLTSLDSLAIRQAIEDSEIGLNMNIFVTCGCGQESEMTLPFSEEFFRPRALRSR